MSTLETELESEGNKIILFER